MDNDNNPNMLKLTRQHIPDYITILKRKDPIAKSVLQDAFDNKPVADAAALQAVLALDALKPGVWDIAAVCETLGASQAVAAEACALIGKKAEEARRKSEQEAARQAERAESEKAKIAAKMAEAKAEVLKQLNKSEQKKAKLVAANDAEVEDDSAPVQKIITNGRALDSLVDHLEEAIAMSCPELFQRNGEIVHVTSTGSFSEDPKARSGIVKAKTSTCIYYETSNSIEFVKRMKNDKNELVDVPDPDTCQYVTQAFLDLGQWKKIRPIKGITRAPFIRPTGEVFQNPGWCDQTHYVYRPTIAFDVAVAANPTKEDAEEALKVLLEPFNEFPFATDSDVYVVLSAILSLLSRPAIDGPLPAHILNADTPGSGKSLLGDAICMIALGRLMPLNTFTANAEEQEKAMAGIALSGTAVCGFDNIEHVGFGGATLNKILSSRCVQMRLLGTNSMPEVDWEALTLATGNNIRVVGDTIRRSIKCNLHPGCEKPELRPIKRAQPLIEYVRESRARLVAAALTIMRAFYVAGKPKAAGFRLGTYNEWQMVSDALVFAGGKSPAADCRVTNEDDSELAAWHTLMSSLADKGLLLARDIIRLAYGYMEDGDSDSPPRETHGEDDLREAIETILPRVKGRRTAVQLGHAFKNMKGRVFKELSIEAETATDTVGTTGKRWHIKRHTSNASVPQAVPAPQPTTLDKNKPAEAPNF